MFFANHTQNVIEIESSMGTVSVKPNQEGSFVPNSSKHYGKYFLKTPGQLKQMIYTLPNEHISTTRVTNNDNQWFKKVERN